MTAGCEQCSGQRKSKIGWSFEELTLLPLCGPSVACAHQLYNTTMLTLLTHPPNHPGQLQMQLANVWRKHVCLPGNPNKADLNVSAVSSSTVRAIKSQIELVKCWKQDRVWKQNRKVWKHPQCYSPAAEQYPNSTPPLCASTRWARVEFFASRCRGIGRGTEKKSSSGLSPGGKLYLLSGVNLRIVKSALFSVFEWPSTRVD